MNYTILFFTLFVIIAFCQVVKAIHSGFIAERLTSIDDLMRRRYKWEREKDAERSEDDVR